MTTPEQAPELLNTTGQFILWQAYCDKKEQCEDLTEQVEMLTKVRAELQKQVDDFCMAYRMKIDVENKMLESLALGIDQWRVDYHELRIEYNALESSALQALEALETAQITLGSTHAAFGGYATTWDKYAGAIAALNKAGVQ